MNAKRLSETKLVTWDPRSSDLLARHISSLVEILTIDANGRVSTTETFTLNVLLKILAENVELHGISSLGVKRGLIQRAAFTRLRKYKQQNVYMFRRAVAAEVRGYLAHPIEKYWVLLPLHLPQDQLGGARSISLLGVRLLFRSWDYVQKRFDLRRFLDLHVNQRGLTKTALLTKFSPVLVLCEGRDVQEALDIADRPFDLLRWLINLTQQFGRTTMQFGGLPRPLGMVLPAPIYGVFDQDRNLREWFSLDVKYSEYRQNTLRGDEIAEVRRFARRLGQPDSDDQTATIMIEALEKYGDALDAFQWRLAFLTLWQILELLALQSSANLNMKTVKSRIIALLGFDPLVRDLLNALYKTRNSLVHRGLFPDAIGLREVNLLKFVVEKALNAFFSLLRICPTRVSLQRYYELVSQNDTELYDRQRLIRNICRKRP